jgi:hypothetical protein
MENLENYVMYNFLYKSLNFILYYDVAYLIAVGLTFEKITSVVIIVGYSICVKSYCIYINYFLFRKLNIISV